MNALKIVPSYEDPAEISASEADAAESLAGILKLIARLHEQAARHADLCSVDETSKFENDEAIRWMDGALEDISATVLGISKGVA